MKAAFGAILLLGWAPSLAAAAVCSRPASAIVQVQVMDPSPRISRSQSLRQINAKAVGHGLVQKGNRALGSTETAIEASMQYKFIGEHHRKGKKIEVCVHITHLVAKFGHKKLRVNLPKEYRPGSCQYNVVYRHEMAHVKVNRDAVKKYAQIYKTALVKALEKQPVLKTTSMEAGIKSFRKQLKAVTAKVTQKFKGEINKSHAKIDAPNGLYAASGRCKSW